MFAKLLLETGMSKKTSKKTIIKFEVAERDELALWFLFDEIKRRIRRKQDVPYQILRRFMAHIDKPSQSYRNLLAKKMDNMEADLMALFSKKHSFDEPPRDIYFTTIEQTEDPSKKNDDPEAPRISLQQLANYTKRHTEETILQQGDSGDRDAFTLSIYLIIYNYFKVYDTPPPISDYAIRAMAAFVGQYMGHVYTKPNAETVQELENCVSNILKTKRPKPL